jgi:hypothetical protein
MGEYGMLCSFDREIRANIADLAQMPKKTGKNLWKPTKMR